MKPTNSRSRSWKWIRRDLLTICCAVLLGPGVSVFLAPGTTQAAQPSTTPDSTAQQSEAKIPPAQLESLVAPIALYPDELLAQTLVASTYPLEIVQLQQWLAKHKDLKDKALADSVAKQPWDPSIQSMAAVPEVVDRLANDLQWTTDLGNAFLAQQQDVMDAVQRMRKKAQETGALKTNEQQQVETKVVENTTVILVESANPEVIYVPVYSPTVVYGPPVYYPYPPIYYPPPPPPGAAFMAFSVGIMWGAAWGGSCCGCGWGGNNVYINVNQRNNFNQINVANGRPGGSGNWQHNSQHRGAAPYGNKATANKYGGSTLGASSSNRQASARQPGGQQQTSAVSRTGSAGASNRSTGGAGVSAGGPSAVNRGGGGAARSSGGGDQIGSRAIPKSSGSKPGGGFSGGSSGFNGSSARASGSRGTSSMGSRGGGGRGGRR